MVKILEPTITQKLSGFFLRFFLDTLLLASWN
jgi:hypothetical protein